MAAKLAGEIETVRKRLTMLCFGVWKCALYEQSFASGRDTFVSLPTGQEKYHIYQLAISVRKRDAKALWTLFFSADPSDVVICVTNFSWSLRQTGTKGRTQIKLSTFSLASYTKTFLRFVRVFKMKTDLARVPNRILATLWACSTRTWHDSCRDFSRYKAYVP